MSPRSSSAIPVVVVLLVALLAVEAALIASFAAGLHDVDLHAVDVDVVAPDALPPQLREALAAADAPIHVLERPSRAAVEDLREGQVFGAFVVPGNGAELLTASARGPATRQVSETVFDRVAATQKVELRKTDVVPVDDGDPRGLVAFYLVICWVVGGYLVAAVLGLARGMAPGSPRAAGLRLGAFALYALASGLVGVAIVDGGYGYLTGNVWAMAGIGALVVFAVAAFSTMLQSFLGLIGTGMVIVLFVVIGDPSAGGPWPHELAAEPWRAVGSWIPNGAGLTALRQAVYFDGHGVSGPVLVIAAYAVIGAALTLVASRRGRPLIDVVAWAATG
jgi:hypothetical protein